MRKIIAVLIAGIIVLAGVALIANHIKVNKTTKEPEEKRRTSTVMRIEAYNTDCLDCEYTRVIILDYENVIVAAPKILPDGSIQDDEIYIHANEDYQLLIPFVYRDEDNKTYKNDEETIHMMIHIGEACEEGYLMEIDYATKAVEISRNEKVRQSEDETVSQSEI